MDKKDLRRSWLADNALLSFLGAVLMGQAWRSSEGTVDLFFTIEVPDYSEFVILAIIVLMFLMSVLLALAVWVPHLQRLAFQLLPLFAPILGVLVWLSFTLGWVSLMPRLPWDQWWTLPLMVAGMMFSFVFIPLRYWLVRSGR